MRPVGSTSSSARYDAPDFVRSLRFVLHGVDGLDDPVLCELRDRHGTQSTAGPRCGSPPPSRPSAISSSTAAASLRRQPNGAARSAAVSSPACASTRPRELRARVGARRAASPGSGHLRASRSCAIAPHGPSCSTRWHVREDELPVQRRDRLVDVLLRSPVTVAQLGAGQRALVVDRRDDLRLEALRRRRPLARRRASAGAAARRSATTRARCLPTQTRPGRGQLVLRAPEERPSPRSSATKPPSASRIAQFCSGLPLTCSQSDGRTTSAFGKSEREADLVDPGCRFLAGVRTTCLD